MGNRDSGLQPERTYQSWSRTIMVGMIVFLLLLRSNILHMSFFYSLALLTLSLFIFIMIIIRKIKLPALTENNLSRKTAAFYCLSLMLVATQSLTILAIFFH